MNVKQGIDLVKALLQPGGASAFLKWKPFSVTSFRVLKRLTASEIPFKTIIDGGANVGQFARAALETFPEARIISFEPLPDVAEKLGKNLADSKDRVRIVNSAVGRKKGEINIYRNAHSHSSSVLPLHENHRKAFPEALATGKLKVSITTLDLAIKKEQLQGPVLLKLDLQGYELEALRGAIKTLSKVKAVLLETSVKPMYKGEPSFAEIDKFLKRKGFRFEKALDYLRDGHGNVLQMDALFLKK